MSRRLRPARLGGVLVLLALAGCRPELPSPLTRPPQAAARDPAEARRLLARGAELFRFRDERDNLLKAIYLWERAARSDGTDAEVWLRLARASSFFAASFLAPTIENNQAEKLRYEAVLEAGVGYAARALAITAPEVRRRLASGEPLEQAVADAPKEAAPALYWYAELLTRWAESKGLFTRLRYDLRTEAMVRRCRALDPAFRGGGADRFLAYLRRATPGMFGGDLDEAARHARTALDLAPNFIENHLALAEVLRRRGDRAGARRALQAAFAAADEAVPPDLQPEQRVARKRAEALRLELDEPEGAAAR